MGDTGLFEVGITTGILQWRKVGKDMITGVGRYHRSWSSDLAESEK